MNKVQLQEELKNRLYGDGESIEEITIVISNPSEDFETYNFIQRQQIVDTDFYVYGSIAGHVEVVNWHELDLQSVDKITEQIIDLFNPEKDATFKIIEGIDF